MDLEQYNVLLVKNVINYILNLILNCTLTSVIITIEIANIRHIHNIFLSSLIILLIATVINIFFENEISQYMTNLLGIITFLSIVLMCEYDFGDSLGLTEFKLNKLFIISLILGLALLYIIVFINKDKVSDRLAFQYAKSIKLNKICKKIQVIFITREIQSRCPWCGAISSISSSSRYNYTNRCHECGGYVAPYNRVVDRLFYPGIIIMTPILLESCEYARDNFFHIFIFELILLEFYYSFYRKYTPYKRAKGISTKDSEISERLLKEEFLFYAKINFNISNWKVFKFWNNKILIIIAVNEEGMAVSHPLCVRIIKHKSRYELTKIMRQIKFDQNECERFFVYLGKDKIGEGEVVREITKL